MTPPARVQAKCVKLDVKFRGKITMGGGGGGINSLGEKGMLMSN